MMTNSDTNKAYDNPVPVLKAVPQEQSSNSIEELKNFLTENGYTHVRESTDGKCMAVMSFLFTTGIVNHLSMESTGIRYCYEKESEAIEAIESYNGVGDPPGPWIKAKGMGIDRLNPAWCSEPSGLWGVDVDVDVDVDVQDLDNHKAKTGTVNDKGSEPLAENTKYVSAVVAPIKSMRKKGM